MRNILLFALSAFAVFGGLLQSAGAGERPAQTVCPITGRQLRSVQSPVRVAVDGFQFAVADADSREKALADPAAAFAALAKNGEAAEPVSQACPVMGNRVNKNIYIQKDGRRVYICCKGCTKRVENNWAKTLDKLAEQAEQGEPDDLPIM